MDVAAFQPLKGQHQKVLRKFVRSGVVRWNRLDFLYELQGILDASMTAHNIMNGFELTGLYPFNSEVVKRKLPHPDDRVDDPMHPSLLPSSNRFAKAKATSQRLLSKYADVLSSPTRQQLPNLSATIDEAILTNRSFQQMVQADLMREERYRNRMRRRRVQPNGDGYQSVSVQQIENDIRGQMNAHNEQSHKREQRFVRRLMKEEEEKWKAIWREEKARTPGKRLTWKQWLENNKERWEGDFIPLGDTAGTMWDMPGDSRPLFFYDTGRGPIPGLSTASHPIREIAIADTGNPSLSDSDEEAVTFFGLDSGLQVGPQGGPQSEPQVGPGPDYNDDYYSSSQASDSSSDLEEPPDEHGFPLPKPRGYRAIQSIIEEGRLQAGMPRGYIEQSASGADATPDLADDMIWN